MSIRLSTTTLPVSNSLETLVELALFIQNCPKLIAKKDLTHQFNLTLRQINFYVATGTIVGNLFDTRKPGHVGKSVVLNAIRAERYAVRQYIMAQAQQLDFMQKTKHLDTPAILNVLINEGWLVRYSEESLYRRASSIAAWWRYIKLHDAE